jgi:hypothetical protein
VIVKFHVRFDMDPVSPLITNLHAVRADRKKLFEGGDIGQCCLELRDEARLFGFRAFPSADLFAEFEIATDAEEGRGDDQKDGYREKFVELPGIVMLKPGENRVEKVEPYRDTEDNESEEDNNEQILECTASAPVEPE